MRRAEILPGKLQRIGEAWEPVPSVWLQRSRDRDLIDSRDQADLRWLRSLPPWRLRRLAAAALGRV